MVSENLEKVTLVPVPNWFFSGVCKLSSMYSFSLDDFLLAPVIANSALYHINFSIWGNVESYVFIIFDATIVAMRSNKGFTNCK